jgi:hypothetical protein
MPPFMQILVFTTATLKFNFKLKLAVKLIDRELLNCHQLFNAFGFKRLPRPFIEVGL